MQRLTTDEMQTAGFIFAARHSATCDDYRTSSVKPRRKRPFGARRSDHLSSGMISDYQSD